MKISGKWLSVFLGALMLSIAEFSAAKEPVVNQPAPGFRVTTFDGKKLSLDDFKGKVLVINFWATWCAPCREELPLLDSYYRIQQRAGLRVLAVTTEDSLPLNKLKPLAAVLTIPMARYFRGSYNTLGAVPTNYIIDRSGVLRYAKAGSFNLNDLNELLVPLLSEPAPVPAIADAGS